MSDQRRFCTPWWRFHRWTPWFWLTTEEHQNVGIPFHLSLYGSDCARCGKKRGKWVETWNLLSGFINSGDEVFHWDGTGAPPYAPPTDQAPTMEAP